MINTMEAIKPNNIASLACDDETDIANLPQFAEENHLKLGSTCLCVDTGKVYAMKSDFSWKEI